MSTFTLGIGLKTSLWTITIDKKINQQQSPVINILIKTPAQFVLFLFLHEVSPDHRGSDSFSEVSALRSVFVFCKNNKLNLEPFLCVLSLSAVGFHLSLFYPNQTLHQPLAADTSWLVASLHWWWTGAGSQTRQLLQPFSHFLPHHCQQEELSDRESCTHTALSLSVFVSWGDFMLSFPLNRCSSYIPPNDEIHSSCLTPSAVNEFEDVEAFFFILVLKQNSEVRI